MKRKQPPTCAVSASSPKRARTSDDKLTSSTSSTTTEVRVSTPEIKLDKPFRNALGGRMMQLKYLEYTPSSDFLPSKALLRDDVDRAEYGYRQKLYDDLFIANVYDALESGKGLRTLCPQDIERISEHVYLQVEYEWDESKVVASNTIPLVGQTLGIFLRQHGFVATGVFHTRTSVQVFQDPLSDPKALLAVGAEIKRLLYTLAPGPDAFKSLTIADRLEPFYTERDLTDFPRGEHSIIPP